jgi:cytochrome c oxidase subunit IV
MTDLSHKINERLEEGIHDAFADHPDDHHHGGIGQYLMVFAALCVLTGMSFFTYSSYWPFREQKQITWAFMLAVSCTKAMLVIMFFMHSLWEANWKWVLTIPASCMSIFLMLMLVPDVGMRQNNGYARYSRERLLWAADPPDVLKSEREVLDEQEQHEPNMFPHPEPGGAH